LPTQLQIFEDTELNKALKTWEASESNKGEIFTNPEIVQFMISTMGLQGKLLDKNTKVLEPSCGHGEFLVAMVQALCQEIKVADKKPSVNQLRDRFRAFELVETNIQETKRKLENILIDYYTGSEIESLLKFWLINKDFLFANVDQEFSHIIGNPPYIRVENIPKQILEEYRRRFSTMSDRADIYVAFFEKSLSLLEKGGRLSFICTDRWTKNQYGRKLRALIDNNYNLDLYVDQYEQNPFQENVLTYPAITQISKSEKCGTVVVQNIKIDNNLIDNVQTALKDHRPCPPYISIRNDITNGIHPWLLGCVDRLALIRKLESNFALIEKTGCRVYIGAATGNNKVFVVDEGFEIEDSRKIPLITSADIRSGKIKPSSKCIINTYDQSGMINLDHFPKLNHYFQQHREALSKRHIAKSSPKNWFKTIDRVYPERAKTQKLLIPDIQDKLTVLHDAGNYHPNNSIYYICSNTWDLHALKAVLISGIGKLFVETYTTKVASGFLRFQAQHLRRIRIPEWNGLDLEIRAQLVTAGEQENIPLAKKLTCKIYKLNEEESELIGD